MISLSAFTVCRSGFLPTSDLNSDSSFVAPRFSVPVNIVEGYGRRAPAERLHFLQIALASLGEVGYCLHAARRLEYLDQSEFENLELHIRQVSAPLRGLMKSLGRPNP